MVAKLTELHETPYYATTMDRLAFRIGHCIGYMGSGSFGSSTTLSISAPVVTRPRLQRSSHHKDIVAPVAGGVGGLVVVGLALGALAFQRKRAASTRHHALINASDDIMAEEGSGDTAMLTGVPMHTASAYPQAHPQAHPGDMQQQLYSSTQPADPYPSTHVQQQHAYPQQGFVFAQPQDFARPSAQGYPPQ